MSATPRNGALHALMTDFESPSQFMHACEKVRDAGFRHWDAHSPFPVHGLDDAMGIRGTRLPYVEVHIKNHYVSGTHSVIADSAIGVIMGLGVHGYLHALDAALRIAGERASAK